RPGGIQRAGTHHGCAGEPDRREAALDAEAPRARLGADHRTGAGCCDDVGGDAAQLHPRDGERDVTDESTIRMPSRERVGEQVAAAGANAAAWVEDVLRPTLEAAPPAQRAEADALLEHARALAAS